MAPRPEASELSPASVVMSPRALQILGGISDPPLRDKVDGVVRRCLVALGEMQRIHLPQDHFEEKASDYADEQHLELVPYVLRAVDAITALLSYLVEQFPAPEVPAESGELEDFDLEFDLVDGPGGGGLASNRGGAAPASPADATADAASAYGSMLRMRVVEFGQRLAAAESTDDSWKLLGELDDFKHRLPKSVQGLLFGVLSVFSNVATREEILPEYRSAVGESVTLRSAVTDLAYQIGRFNEGLTDPDIAIPLLVGVADHLARFSGRPAYRTLRAEDKRAVIDFRRELHALRFNRGADGKLPMARLRQVVEGFSKFLESLQAINHREVLVLHDRQVLSAALEELRKVPSMPNDAEARRSLDTIIAKLAAVSGRNPDLDQMLRQHKATPPQGPAAGVAPRWLPLVQMTLAMVG